MATTTTPSSSRKCGKSENISAILEPIQRGDWKEVLSEVNYYPVPDPYPRKPSTRVHGVSHKPFTFLTRLFMLRGTVIPHLLLQFFVAVFLVVVIKLLIKYGHFNTSVQPRIVTLHTTIGSVLAFVTVFRLNRSYDCFVEGRKLLATTVSCLRTSAMDMYINDAPEGSQEGRDRVVALAEEYRRKALILFSFMRQAVRESREGFCPGSDVERTPFNHQTFFIDPCRPRLVDLLTQEEVDRYSRSRVGARPVMVIAELKMLIYQVTQICNRPQFRGGLDGRLQEVLNSLNGMVRLVELHIPSAYSHIINLLIFLFVYGAPFIYSTPESTKVWDFGLWASVLLGLVYYGIEHVSAAIVNPYGYDSEDHDLEMAGVQLNVDLVEVARLAGVSNPRVFMAPELFKGLEGGGSLGVAATYTPPMPLVTVV